MGQWEYQQDVDFIERYCASRGIGYEGKNYFVQRAGERHSSFDRLVRDGELLRGGYKPVTEQILDAWRNDMDDSQRWLF